MKPLVADQALIVMFKYHGLATKWIDYGVIAQLVERLLSMQEVRGSKPCDST